ncbi:Uncharacterized protein TCM_001593 [Theobroma cacao]|uniref:Uncharacterized protein n=1 Tax=Theobroma cacao TaxID=3641 RepID=A0A061DRY0_THECC|nr:Uncharacterized protein TCM_001593 [Theobroma cacao]
MLVVCSSSILSSSVFKEFGKAYLFFLGRFSRKWFSFSWKGKIGSARGAPVQCDSICLPESEGVLEPKIPLIGILHAR